MLTCWPKRHSQIGLAVAVRNISRIDGEHDRKYPRPRASAPAKGIEESNVKNAEERMQPVGETEDNESEGGD